MSPKRQSVTVLLLGKFRALLLHIHKANYRTFPYKVEMSESVRKEGKRGVEEPFGRRTMFVFSRSRTPSGDEVKGRDGARSRGGFLVGAGG